MESSAPSREEVSQLGKDKKDGTELDMVLIRHIGCNEFGHRDYVKALARISAMDTSLNTDKAGVEVNVPIQVARMFLNEDMFNGVWRAEQYIREQWRNVERGSQIRVPSGSLKCTFVLEPMVTDLSYQGPITTKLANTMESAMRTEYQSGDERGSWSDSENGLWSIPVVHLKCNGDVDLEVACSAIVTDQTTTKLSISFDGYRGFHQFKSEKWWKCLAYALFSRRARKYSSLKSFALSSIRHMSVTDMEAFGVVLASDPSKDNLLDCHRGHVDVREAALYANSQVRYEPDEHREFTTSKMALPSSLPLAQAFDDDGTKPLVSRLVTVTSLTIGLEDRDDANSDGLPLFLQNIGQFLENLTIINMDVDVDVNTILRSCPNLLELTLHSGMVTIRFNFRGFLKHKERLPVISNDWDEPDVLIKILCGVSDPYVNCVQRLRVYALHLSDPEDDEQDIDSVLKSLLQMLDVNQTLEYLDVIAPKEYQHYLALFRTHHVQPIYRSRGYELQSKLAFLSIQQSSDEVPNKKHTAILDHPVICALDRLALSNIFAFAAAPVLRQVYFREERPSDS